MNFNGKTIVIGISGGIAAYKSCEVVSALKKMGADVHIVMTKNAMEFVAPLTFETLSGNRVIFDTFNRDYTWEVEHISLAKKADLLVIAPCTANVAAKLAGGIADDFLTTTAMAMTCPIIIAPAMNTNMMNSAAYQANEKLLSERGVIILKGESGYLACGDIGSGRMAEPHQILELIGKTIFPKRDYEGKTIIITAGGTSEAIDPVRFITNRSSGKMGLELAKASLNRGANVIFVAGSVSVDMPDACEIIRVKSTIEMHDAVMENFSRADIIIKAAAPSDYRVLNERKQKIKSEKLTLELVKNPDIAKAVGKAKGDKKLIIFSAETENLTENASKKLVKKNADMVIANDVTMEGAGFNVDTNIVTIITKDARESFEKMSKCELSDIILDKIAELK